MKIDAAQSVLLVIDIQEKLLPVIHEKERILENALWLTRLANLLEIPVMASEQYPKGLGATVPELRNEFAAGAVGEKTAFSCADGCLAGLPGNDRTQVILCGIEAHVCVLQTALDFRSQGKDVFIADEAVGSRRPRDKELALARMRDEGVRIVSREMIAFEWLKGASHPHFRTVSKEFVR